MTVFALTLVDRTIRRSDEANDSNAQNRVRLWDSISVTFELAAAALLTIEHEKVGLSAGGEGFGRR